MSEDKTALGELIWLYRLKQSGFFGAETPQGELLEANPLHDPRACLDCRLGPCDWLTRQLEQALRFSANEHGLEPRASNTGVNGRLGTHAKSS